MYRASAPSYWCICPLQSPTIPYICKNIIEREGITGCFQTGEKTGAHGSGPQPPHLGASQQLLAFSSQSWRTNFSSLIATSTKCLCLMQFLEGRGPLLRLEQLQALVLICFAMFITVIICSDKHKRDVACRQWNKCLEKKQSNFLTFISPNPCQRWRETECSS